MKKAQKQELTLTKTIMLGFISLIIFFLVAFIAFFIFFGISFHFTRGGWI